MYNPHLNDIYITKRLRRRLNEISNHAITTIIAPMGFGKTTGLDWWTKQLHKKDSKVLVLKQMILTDSPTDFLNSLCITLREYPVLTEQIKALAYAGDQRSIAMMAELIKSEFSNNPQQMYYVLDDLHNMPQRPFGKLLLYLSKNLPESKHIIIMSRNQIFREEERMLLGSSLCEITADDLRWNYQELKTYADQCGLDAAEEDLKTLADMCEGWISMIYLNFKAYAHHGSWLSNSEDIYTLIYQVLLEPLSDREQEFLITIAITDEFTAKQAKYLWGYPDAVDLLDSLSKNNAFITKNETGIFRYHHMLQICAMQEFAKKPEDLRRKAYSRLGEWYYGQEEYVRAYYSFDNAKDWKGLLKTIEKDKAKSLNSEHSKDFFSWVENCPKEYFMKYPSAITSCMVKMFSFHNIPELKRMKSLLLESLDQDTGLSVEERNNLLGDAELAESFLSYNDISAMSEYHRRACNLLNRTSYSVDPKGAWTFSAPSIFMMYHRMIGSADIENNEMKECMPYYYQVTDGHGKGAEHVFEAELYYERGKINDADIINQMAMSAAKRKNQYSIMLCSEFLFMRMELFKGRYESLIKRINDCRKYLYRQRQYTLLNTLDMCQVYIYSLLSHPEKAPSWMSEGRLDESLVMFPAKPMLYDFYNQLLLSMGNWTTIISAASDYQKVYSIYNNVMNKIRLNIQLSIAYENIGRHAEALEKLHTALSMAVPDGIIMPFAENESYINPLLLEFKEGGIYHEYIESILLLSLQFNAGRQKILWEAFREHEDYGLTERELIIAKLAVERKTNTEIANKLNLAPGTVRNQLSRIYDKLNISGNVKNKRIILEEHLKNKK